MVSVVVCLVLGLVLVSGAAMKAVGGAGARAALATYGVRSPRAAAIVWGALIVVEVVLGIAVGAGQAWAARAAATFMAGACGVQVAALAAGRGGAPCACFRARGGVPPRPARRAPRPAPPPA